MSDNVIYKMEPITNYNFDDIDCFICVAHDDERAVASVNNIIASGINIKHVIIINYNNEESDVLKNLFKSQYEKVSASNDVKSFIKEFKKAVKPYFNQKIVIDISCIRIPDIFSIMKILKLNEHKKPIPCIYSIPYDYKYSAGDFSYKDSLGDLQNYELIGYSGEYDSEEQDSTFIVFLGFEGALSIKVLEDATYKQLIFVNSLPAFYQKYKDISILNNRSAIIGKDQKSIMYVPADNPFEVYNFLEKNYAKLASICISPLGTKPVALGICLFALDYEKVRVVYPVSDKYSIETTTKVTKSLVYEISLFA